MAGSSVTILKLKDCFSCDSIQNEKLWVFLPGSPKPLNLCSRLLFCPAVLFYPQKRITAETECIDKRNLQKYVESAFTEAPCNP